MIKNSVLKAIKQFSMLDKSHNVTVALSGGADSVTLLHILHELRDELGITISAAHLNHMIRGDEALRDENFAREQCQKLGIPFFCERADVPKYAKEHRKSTELAAREIRYDFLSRVSDGLIATAHTASDNIETMIFNLARGTGLKGLCGIPPVRGNIIRPLILCTREEIEEYCKSKELSFVTDSTNLSDDYSRNKIRHIIVPVLKEINAAAEKNAVRTSASLSEDELFLRSCADRFLSDNVSDGTLDITNLPAEPVAKRSLKFFSESAMNGTVLDSEHINSIYTIAQNGGRTSLPENMSAESLNGRLYIKCSDGEIKTETQYFVSTERRKNHLFKKNKKVNNLLLNNSLDCDKIMGKLVIRTRMPGDSIRLKGRNCTKTLKKLMNELEIPKSYRDKIPVIADDNGVIWVYGIGTAQRCAVTEKTSDILIINVSERKI